MTSPPEIRRSLSARDEAARAEDATSERAPVGGALAVVGVGIAGPAHVTREALAAIRAAETRLVLVADLLTLEWLEGLVPGFENLADAYAVGKSRDLTYEEMTERVLAPVRRGKRVRGDLLRPPRRLRDVAARGGAAGARGRPRGANASRGLGARLPVRRRRHRSRRRSAARSGRRPTSCSGSAASIPARGSSSGRSAWSASSTTARRRCGAARGSASWLSACSRPTRRGTKWSSTRRSTFPLSPPQDPAPAAAQARDGRRHRDLDALRAAASRPRHRPEDAQASRLRELTRPREPAAGTSFSACARGRNTRCRGSGARAARRAPRSRSSSRGSSGCGCRRRGGASGCSSGSSGCTRR